MRSPRLWVLLGIGVVLLSLVALAVLAVTGQGRGQGFISSPVGGRIAVIPLSGGIQDGSDAFSLSGGITPAHVRRQLQRAERDPRVKAVVLRVNSPGGTVAASQEIADMVKAFPKPLVVSMGDMAASGGYYISAHADRIVAQPGTLTGSIGVIWTFLDPSGLMEKVGVKLDTVTSGKNKDMFLPGRLTPERREIVQQMSDLMYEQFVQAVASGRKLAEEKVRPLATGQVYTGEQALELGLVDELGGQQQAVEAAAKLAAITSYTVVTYEPSFLDLFSQTGVKVADLLQVRLLGAEMALLQQVLTPMIVPRY